MQSFWLSVLIPVYNVQAYLDACVDSVAGQADSGVEILLLDDCSTDASASLMAEARARWPDRHIRLLGHARNQGLSAARNTMLAAARGEYLWFIDSDDVLMPGAIAGAKQAIERHQPDLLLCDFQMVRERSRLKHRLRGESHRRTFKGPASTRLEGGNALLAGLFITGQLHAWSKVSRRSLWGEDLRFPQGKYFEDMATMPRLALRARSAVYCPQPWLGYRQHGASILANMTLGRMADLSASLRVFRQEWAQRTPAAQESGSAFAASHLAARNFVGCMKAWQRGSHPPALAAQFLADLEASSILPLAQLLRAYVRRGWWLRAWRLRQAILLAQQHPRPAAGTTPSEVAAAPVPTAISSPNSTPPANGL